MKKLVCILLLFCSLSADAASDPWQPLVDAFNNNFEELRKLSCADTIPYRVVVGDIVTADQLNKNFATIIRALKDNKCKK